MQLSKRRTPRRRIDVRIDTCCPYCEEDWAYGPAEIYGCDVLHGDDDRFVVWRACCEDVHASVEALGFEATYGVTLKYAVRLLTGMDVVEITEPGDSTVVCRLVVDNRTVVRPETDAHGNHRAQNPSGWRTEVFSEVDEHHTHHDPPLSWKFGLAVHNGGIRVGVAVVGRPTSRMLQKAEPHTLEVTRVATWGSKPLRKNASSKLYAAVCKQARALGCDKLITYTLKSESGHSLIAAGWTPTHRSAGGSWDRENRPREDRAPTEPKIRWERGLTKRIQRDVLRRSIAPEFA